MQDDEDREFYRRWKNVRKTRREMYGVDCPGCIKGHPNRNPTKLMPQQKCKVCGYRDPRPRLTQEQQDAPWEANGFKRVNSQQDLYNTLNEQAQDPDPKTDWEK
jgi:hypothetical protein